MSSPFHHKFMMARFGIHCENFAYPYRSMPIPYTGHKRYRYIGFRRINKSKVLKYEIEAYPEFARMKRKQVRDTWDDVWRSNVTNKSWKNQKKKKQWM